MIEDDSGQEILFIVMVTEVICPHDDNSRKKNPKSNLYIDNMLVKNKSFRDYKRQLVLS